MKYSDKELIRGSKGNELLGKKVTLCVTGSISAYRSIDVARELIRFGADVHVVMSHSATEIVHPYVFEWATGNPVVTELTGGIEHVALGSKTDLILIAPCTANTLAKIASGISDTPVTAAASVALGSQIPIVIALAMHGPMYKNKAIIDAIERLRSMGVIIIEPKMEENKAKFPDIDDIVFNVINVLYPKDLKDMNFLVTAGATIEYIDPVRIITNKSSGKMGIQIAEEAYLRGANVTLILGRSTVKPRRGIRVINVETTEDMFNAVLDELRSSNYQVFIAAGAPADFKVKNPSHSKINSRTGNINLELEPTPKIVEHARKVNNKTLLVTFKAEYNVSDEVLIKEAEKYLNLVNADLVIANDVGRFGAGFGTDTNEVFIVGKQGLIKHISLSSKKIIAQQIINVVKSILEVK
ncbi:MAG: bifunctional phosphopantothenoylcysteine decarboxylase/phosphopantothenate--cysteine ligase CoaBC [Thermoprotei archaeon]